jgi:hypothetical protein
MACVEKSQRADRCQVLLSRQPRAHRIPTRRRFDEGRGRTTEALNHLAERVAKPHRSGVPELDGTVENFGESSSMCGERGDC